MDSPSQNENVNYPSTICRTYGAGRQTLSISRINPPKFGGGLKFESDADIGEKHSFRSGTNLLYDVTRQGRLYGLLMA
jgi:hypothetical protein